MLFQEEFWTFTTARKAILCEKAFKKLLHTKETGLRGNYVKTLFTGASSSVRKHIFVVSPSLGYFVLQ